MTPVDGIALLRRVVARLIDAGDPDAPAMAAAIAEYEAGARYGVTLGRALGLEGVPGPGWWVTEARQRRDRLARQLAAAHFPGRAARAAAAGMLGRRALAQQLRATGAPVSARTLRRALGR